MLAGMQVFRYWAWADVDQEGREVGPDGAVTGATGWSDLSIAEAQAMARERAVRFPQWLRESPENLRDRYGYLDRPVREPILEEITSGEERIAALTRTGYGAVVLNTARLFIADIDDPRPSPLRALRGLWGRMRGSPLPPWEQEVRAVVERVIAADGSLGIRLYRTAAGHRAIVTSRGIDAQSEDATRLLGALGSDPLYIRLCGHQQCFRARLTPKPWRINLAAPNLGPFPPRWDDTRAMLAEWVGRYDARRGDWGVCRLLGTFGPTAVDDEIQPVLELHDQWTLADGRPLA